MGGKGLKRIVQGTKSQAHAAILAHSMQREREYESALVPINELLQADHKSLVLKAYLVRSLRGLQQIASRASHTSLADAVAESTDIGVILRTLEDPAVIPAEETEGNPLMTARIRGARMKRNLLRECGGGWSASEVAEFLNITRQAVQKRRKKGTLLAVNPGGGGYVFPIWQFDDGGVIAGLEKVLTSFVVENPWTKLSFFLTGDPRLGGRTPIDALRAEEVEAVRRAAASYGEHGAA